MAGIPECPKCGSAVGILYGLPSKGALEEARQGKIALGGCIVEDDRPLRHRPDCEHRWR